MSDWTRILGFRRTTRVLLNIIVAVCQLVFRLTRTDELFIASVAVAEDWQGSRIDGLLIEYAEGDLRKLAFEKDQSMVGDCPARKSKLLDLLTQPKGHEGIRLGAADIERLITWMDTYAHRQGSFSENQEEQLRELKRKLAPMLAE